MKEPTNEVDKNAIAVVHTNFHCKEDMVGKVQQNIFMIVSLFLSLLHCALYIFANGKRIKHGGE